MQSQDRVNFLLRLYEKSIDSWSQRRAYEWKVTILIWTGVVASSGFLVGKLKLTYYHLIGYIALWLVYYLLWLRGVWTANSKDKHWAQYYRERAEVVLGIRSDSPPPPTSPRTLKFFTDWSMVAQAIFTGMLLLFGWYVLSEC